MVQSRGATDAAIAPAAWPRDDVVLIHGYFQGPRDMAPMARHLRRLGFRPHRVGLGTTFNDVDACAAALAEALARLELAGEQTHLVGHSMGGLIIRRLLADRDLARLGRVVLVATPNAGSPLADRLAASLGVLPAHPFGALASLVTTAPPIPPPRAAAIDIGVVAGTRPRPPLGALIAGPNDGRIPLAATPLPDMADFLALPLDHRRIHRHPTTAAAVARFLRAGRFGP